MRMAQLALVGCLAVWQTSCSAGFTEGTFIGRWESEDTPSLCCEFTEDGVVRIRGDFGHAVGTFPLTGRTRARIHLSGHGRRDLPDWVQASIVGDTLILEAPDGRQAKFRRR
ncbi:MAG TPA: hypothetical protein VEL76_37980 [Gemmataceae bacterium]|nr:hypothetical protein [Gemmataceae bacterium]